MSKNNNVGKLSPSTTVVTRFLHLCAVVLLALAAPEARSASACREGVVSSTGEVIVSQEVDEACGNERASQIPAQEPTGLPGAVPGGMPTDMSPLSGQEELDRQAVRSANDVPGPYTNYPYSTIGRLEITWRNGERAACTAASIGNQAIWTAGHCVYQKNQGGWAAEIKFAPAYKDGHAPFGWWFANKFWATQAWIDWGDRLLDSRPGIRRDMGGAILNLNERGESISYVVGWLGFSWNQPREQYYHLFGYPGAPSPPFSPDAPRMFGCEGQSTGIAWNVGSVLLGPAMQTMECDMGYGASGGPWITDLSNQDGANFVNGNQSDGHFQYPGKVLSPYFDDSAYNLWVCLVKGC